MFKGPAALTGASSVNSSGAITTSGNISTSGSGTITSAGALTVSSGGVTVTGAGITVGGNIVMTGSRITALGSPSANDEAATKGYVDTTVLGASGDTVLANVTTMTTPGIYNSVNIDSNNVINFANTADTTAGQITGTLALGTASNGKKLFVSWAAKNAAHTLLKVDFGANKLYDAVGTEARYLTFSNVGASILMFYSDVGTGHWIISGSGATPSIS